MVEQSIYYERYGWDIAVFYDASCKDTDYILYELKGIGCYGDQLYRARKNLEACGMNTGITFANMQSKQMVIVISKTTSAKHFLNTMIHELHHAAEFIAREAKVKQTGEEISYISGDLSMLMYSKAGHYLCECCRDKE